MTTKTSAMILAEAGYADYDRNPADIARDMDLRDDGSDWPQALVEADEAWMTAESAKDECDDEAFADMKAREGVWEDNGCRALTGYEWIDDGYSR